MGNCANCSSKEIKQTSSIVNRLLISAYLFLAFIFFIGGFYYQAVLAFIPLIIPYKNICYNCNYIFYKRIPKFNMYSEIEHSSIIRKYLVAMAPSILVISLLIMFFPYTGLARIIYIPLIFIINSIVIYISLILTRNLNNITYYAAWVVIIILTLILTIIFYPQESGIQVIKIIFSY